MTNEQNRDRCQACGKLWTDHGGISVTCAEVKRLRDALYAIYMVEHTLPDGSPSHSIENNRRWKIAKDALTWNPEGKVKE